MKTKLSALIICFMFLFSGSAFAVSYTLYPAPNVFGSPDIYVAPEMSPPFGDQSEIDFVNNLLDTTYTLNDYYKFDGLGSSDLISLGEFDGNDYWAFDFGDLRPDYFLFVQAGQGYLYENVMSKQYAVVSFNDVSHISTFGGNDTPVSVPEPAALLLFGAGLTGLAVYRRRSSK